jgi:heterotetrameric sarcosine oxidase delta subunit
MSFLLECPNCGLREVAEFTFGGEVHPRPAAAPTARELNAYVYFRRNAAGPQIEWWQHRSGCRAWFLARRDTRNNAVEWTARPPQAPIGATASARLAP